MLKGAKIDKRLEEAAAMLSNGAGGLLVVQTAFLGDVVLTTGLLRAAKKAFPKAQLSVLILPEFVELVAGWADEVITVAKRSSRAALEWAQAHQVLQNKRVAAALLPHRSARSSRFAASVGAIVRIGFNRGGGRFFHTHRVKYETSEFEGARNVSLLKTLAPTNDNGLSELKLTGEHFQRVNEILEELELDDGKFIVVAPAAAWPNKLWPTRYYRQLEVTIFQRYRLKTVIVGGKADRQLCELTALDARLNLAGLLTPMESATLMKRSALAISGDSAPAHIAAAVYTRQVVIMGPTAPRYGFIAPTGVARAIGLDLWCRPCSDHGRKQCPVSKRLPCLDDIKPEMVLNVIEDWIEEAIK